jgi:hypothetical protein
MSSWCKSWLIHEQELLRSRMNWFVCDLVHDRIRTCSFGRASGRPKDPKIDVFPKAIVPCPGPRRNADMVEKPIWSKDRHGRKTDMVESETRPASGNGRRGGVRLGLLGGKPDRATRSDQLTTTGSW